MCYGPEIVYDSGYVYYQLALVKYSIQSNILIEIAQYIGVIQLTLKVHHIVFDTWEGGGGGKGCETNNGDISP